MPWTAQPTPLPYGQLAWWPRAACRGMGPDLFHPDPPGKGRHPKAHHAQIAEAKAVCAGCPVRTECLDDALLVPKTIDIHSGAIRGGLTALERHPEELRRRQNNLHAWRYRERQA